MMTEMSGLAEYARKAALGDDLSMFARRPGESRDSDFTETLGQFAPSAASRACASAPTCTICAVSPTGRRAIAMDASVSAAPAATSCLVCGGTRAERRFVQRGYPVYCCQACGLQFV